MAVINLFRRNYAREFLLLYVWLVKETILLPDKHKNYVTLTCSEKLIQFAIEEDTEAHYHLAALYLANQGYLIG